ncbi:M20 family metallopeptidase [Chitinispirillales bacterium ANBcel5]|uniref:M20 metallopeptidase family protein n=1 Tax=Cellulosispirillum alkaliphilum TaxID=3039283 RepID=UPI002A4EE1EF|nr:M20 family metallopeptidase [Chitinispirillales bacterium ANBcel5]
MIKNELYEDLKAEVERRFADIVKIRRVLHQNPELSGEEFSTARLVYTTLKEWGFEPRYHLNKTAVSVKIENGDGKTVVLRADMDALPLLEENQVPYCSKNPGVMHACGHDMHTAILLGAADILQNFRQHWKGTLLCLFQPSEEQEPGGAYGLMEQGVFPRNADAVFGLHVSADHPTGTIGIKEGFDYAGVTTFDVTVRGRGGHGATPEKTIDPIVCTASMISALQTLISRELSPFAPAVLTIGSVHAGTKRNIIPDTASFAGTLRSHDSARMEYLIDRISTCLKNTATAFRADCEVEFNRSYPPGYNDPALSQRATEIYSSFFGKESVIERSLATMYAEDFSRYQQCAPGLFIHLGVRPLDRDTMEGIHTPRFLPDESAIKSGMVSHVLFALDNLVI